jgi:cold shock CspA family protein
MVATGKLSGNGFKTLQEGKRVSVDLVQGPKGQAGLQHPGRLSPISNGETR